MKINPDNHVTKRPPASTSSESRSEREASSISGRSKGRKTVSSSNSKKSKTIKRMKRVRIIVILVVVLLVLGVFGKIAYDMYHDHEYQKKVNSIAINAHDITDNIETILTSRAPRIWVYDRDENLLMTLKVSKALQSVDQVPDIISKKIFENSGGDPVGLVVREYLLEHSIPSSNGNYDGYYKRVTDTYSVNDVVRYLAVTSLYGGAYNGASDAASNYFGVDFQNLNEMQQEFLAYTYRNEVVDIESYLQDKNLNEDRLGLILNQTSYSVVRSKVLSELESLNIDTSSTNLLIKLSTSTQQQSTLQSIVDNKMRQFIELNSDGTYVYNCSSVVIDRNSGYIRCYIPGRTASHSNSQPFSMNILGYRSNFASLYKLMNKTGIFGETLQEVTLENGDVVLRSIEELFNNMSLAENKSTDLQDSINIARSMFSNVSEFKDVSLIYQVTNDLGNTLYKSEGSSKLDFNSNNLYYFFSDKNQQDLTQVSEIINLSTGIISFKITSDYVLITLVGTGSLGGAVTDNVRSTMKSVVVEIENAVSSFYPTPSVPIWNGAGITDQLKACYTSNQKKVEDTFTNLLDELSAIEISSFSARKEFETKYEKLNNFINEYESYVGSVYAESLREAVQSIRTDRTELLVKYSV